MIMSVAAMAAIQPTQATELPQGSCEGSYEGDDTVIGYMGVSYHVPADRSAHEDTQYGVASWYGPGFIGRKTASGERFSKQLATAAHRHLPLGTHVLVTNLKNGKSTVVKINDRGPYVRGRLIDLSPAAAQELAMTHDGLTRVRIDVID
jgi:rare lipoprotein A